MLTFTKYPVGLSCAALLLASFGCQQGPPRISIRGTVTYQDAKIADGWITFVPKNAEKGTQEAARILDGKYELPGANGLLPGEYGVSITATEPAGKPAAAELPGAPRRGKALIPEEYNRLSTLTIEVSAEGKRDFDFNLK